MNLEQRIARLERILLKNKLIEVKPALPKKGISKQELRYRIRKQIAATK